MVGTAAISAFGAASQWVIMVLLGLPLAFPLAVLALFAGFIPYIGGFIATFLAFLVAVAVGSPTDIVDHGHLHARLQHHPGQLRHARSSTARPSACTRRSSSWRCPSAMRSRASSGMFLVVPVAGVIATTWRAILQVIDVGGSDTAVPVPEARAGDEPGPVGFGAESETRVGEFDPA